MDPSTPDLYFGSRAEEPELELQNIYQLQLQY